MIGMTTSSFQLFSSHVRVLDLFLRVRLASTSYMESYQTYEGGLRKNYYGFDPPGHDVAPRQSYHGLWWMYALDPVHRRVAHGNALEVAALSAGTKSCTSSAACHSFASGSESHHAYLNSGSISSYGWVLGPDLGRAAID